MEARKGTKSIFIKIGVWLIALSFLYIGIKLFSWGLAVGAFLIVSFFIYLQAQTIKAYYREIQTNLSESKFVKPYCYIGILQSFLTIIICLTLLSSIIYSVIYGKSREAVLSEIFRQNYIGYIFTFFGCSGTLRSIHLIWGNFLVGKFSSLEHSFSFGMIYLGFISITFFVVGILLLTR